MPDLIAADKASAEQRGLAMDAVNDEVRRILLGFDLSEVRFEKLLTFLEAPLPAQLSSTFPV